MTKPFVFSMPEREAEELFQLGYAIEGVLASDLKRSALLVRALTRLDEQKGCQTRAWERCEACDGSGWVEGK